MGDDKVKYSMTGIRAQGTVISFQSSEMGPPPHPLTGTAQHNRYQGTWYTEYHAFFPVVRIGSPHPLTPPGSVPLDPRGETHSLAGEGVGDPIPTKGQTLWYSMHTISPLRIRVSRINTLN
jgi:hypothetical protein